MKRKNLALWLALVLLLLTTGGAVMQTDEGPKMTLALAWDGQARMPGWVELHLLLDNEGSDWSGEVLIEDKGRKIDYRIPVALPAHSHKSYRIPVFAPASGLLPVTLRSGDAVLEQEQLSIHTVAADERFCVVADPLQAPALPACDQQFVVQDVTTLPEEPAVWEAIDLLLLHDVPATEMTEAQWQALGIWVSNGGHLVLMEGVGAEAMLAGLPAPLQPVRRQGGRFVPQAGSRQLTFDGLDGPVYRRSWGQGTVDWVKETSPSMLAPLWADDPYPATGFMLAAGYPAWEGRKQTLSDAFPSAQALFNTPTAALPTYTVMPLLVLVYIIFLILVPYLVSRRLRRPMLAWLLMPAIILMALILLACWLSGFASGSFPITHTLEIVWVPEQGEMARLIGGGATFAPRSRHLRWHVPGAARPGRGAFDNAASAWMAEGDPFEQEITIDADGATYEVRKVPSGIITWGWETTVEAPAMTFEARIDQEGVHLTMASEAPLQAAMLYIDDGFVLPLEQAQLSPQKLAWTYAMTDVLPTANYYEDDTACGTSLFSLNQAPGPWSAVPPEEKPKPGTPQRTAPPTCYLIAEGEGESDIFELRGQIAGERCYVYRVPCPALQAGTFISLPQGSLVIEDGAAWISEDSEIVLNDSTVAFSFIIPGYLHTRPVRALEFALRPGTAPPMPPTAMTPTATGPVWSSIDAVSIWNWESGQWEPLPKPTGTAILIDPATPYVSAEGKVTFRLEGVHQPWVVASLAVRVGEEP